MLEWGYGQQDHITPLALAFADELLPLLVTGNPEHGFLRCVCQRYPSRTALSPTLFKSEGKKPIRWSCDERASSSTGNTNEWNAPYLRDRAAPGARSPCR